MPLVISPSHARSAPPAGARHSRSARFVALCFALLGTLPIEARLPALQVSENRRFLATADGQPFFWLGDTAWELFHRLNREEAVHYLDTRARQGFNVIQAVALAELDGLTVPNAHGDLPLVDRDPARPAITPGSNPADATAYDYWDHVEFIVDEANRRGLYVAFLPTWGSWAPSTSTRDKLVVFTPENAEAFGRFLGARFGGKDVVWVLGGDRDVTGHEAIWPAMARGLAAGQPRDAARPLMTFHPVGGDSSTTWFHDAPWLDFNMAQTGHRHIDDPARPTVWARMESDYSRTPAKPVLDGEPLYEDHPIGFGAARAGERGYALDAHIRQRTYWSVFGGGFGVTYGHHSVWQMVDIGRRPINGTVVTWRGALERPAAQQMRHLRALMESRPFFARVPDLSLVVDLLRSQNRIAATRGADYAFIYTAQGQPFSVNMGKISGARVIAWWFNPRAGSAEKIGEFDNTGTREFAPPNYGGLGTDLVLVLDDASKHFPPPGAR